MTEAVDCSVCAEKFTGYTRKKISCGYCSYNACKVCVSRYLLSQVSEPHCMNCKTGWNFEFLDSNLTKAFVKGPLRDNKKKIYLNREKALLPNFQQYAAAKMKMNEITPKLSEVSKIKHEAEHNRNLYISKIFNIKKQLYRSSTENENAIIETLKNTIKENGDAELNCTILSMKYIRIQQEYGVYYNLYDNGDSKSEMKEFIMKCVKEGCRGFLSQAYKCELCRTYVCNDCMIPKKEKNDTSHECKKDDVESVALIRKETRPCPKCGIRISKIDGCDMMWCTATNCGTAFSWNNGKVLNGTIHNPHYYEWLRRNNNGVIPRQPGDVPCGGFPDYYSFQTQVRNLGSGSVSLILINSIYSIHRCFMDIQEYRIPLYTSVRDPNMFKDIHVDYLLGKINEEHWTQNIFMKELNMEKRQAVLAVLQTFLGAGQDLFRGIVNALNDLSKKNNRANKCLVTLEDFKTVSDILKQFETLREYINDCLVTTGKAVSTPVPQFSNNWEWIPVASVTKIKAIKEEEKNKSN